MTFLLGLTPNKIVNNLKSSRSPRWRNFRLWHFIEQCHNLFLLIVILPELVQGQHVSADFNHLSSPHIVNKLSTITLMIHMRDILGCGIGVKSALGPRVEVSFERDSQLYLFYVDCISHSKS